MLLGGGPDLLHGAHGGGRTSLASGVDVAHEVLHLPHDGLTTATEPRHKVLDAQGRHDGLRGHAARVARDRGVGEDDPLAVHAAAKLRDHRGEGLGDLADHLVGVGVGAALGDGDEAGGQAGDPAVLKGAGVVDKLRPRPDPVLVGEGYLGVAAACEHGGGVELDPVRAVGAHAGGKLVEVERGDGVFEHVSSPRSG